MMLDPRVDRLADVLVHYSLGIRRGDRLWINGSVLAESLFLAVNRKAVQAGAHVFMQPHFPAAIRHFFQFASDDQLDDISPIDQILDEIYDVQLFIQAPENSRYLANIDPSRLARRLKARGPLEAAFSKRVAQGEARWCATQFPTQAGAQDAEMSLDEYEDFSFAAMKLLAPDPMAAWELESRRQAQLKAWLEGKDQVQLRGSDIDLRLSIQGRSFAVGDGKVNMPDGEIYTSPVEQSVNGWARFRYPSITVGREVQNIELWFEDGKVVKSCAEKGEDLLLALLDTDPGSRYLGEWGIGTNYDLPHYSKNILFDEKLGGTIHLAIGSGYPETGGQNESGVHWDMICDMTDSEILVDGELFYRNGKPALWQAADPPA